MTAEKLVAQPFRLEGFTDEETFGVVRDLFGDPDGSWGIAAIYHVDGELLADALADETYELGPRQREVVEALRRDVVARMPKDKRWYLTSEAIQKWLAERRGC